MLQKNVLKISLKLSLLIFASVTMAANAPVPDHGGLYLGAGLGYGAIDTGSELKVFPDGGSLSSKTGGLTTQVHGGYLWRLFSNLAIGPDLAYTFYPRSTQTRSNSTQAADFGSVKASALDLSAVLTYFIADFNVSARAGFSATTQTATINGHPTGDIQYTLPLGGQPVLQPLVGLGLGYAIPAVPNLTLTLEAQYIVGTSFVGQQKNNNINNDTAATFMSAGRSNALSAILAGFTYRFGKVGH